MKYQVTIFCSTGTYKPVSCIIELDTAITTKEQKKQLINRGVTKICGQRSWSQYHLKKYGYTSAKVREYDLESIKAESKARYERIKEEKYASGEWKRPKSSAVDVKLP